MSADAKDLERIEARFESVCDKLDVVLRLLGRVEPWLEEAPRAREKVQALEVEVATQKTKIQDVRDEMKEDRQQQFWKNLLTSGSTAALAFAASYLMPHK